MMGLPHTGGYTIWPSDRPPLRAGEIFKRRQILGHQPGNHLWGANSHLNSYLMTTSPCEESHPNLSFKASKCTIF